MAEIENNAFVVECLKLDIEKKIGRNLLTPSDFNFLSLQISSQTGEKVSMHTLMRLWGYIRTSVKPSLHTLSILSRFLEYESLSEYMLELNAMKSRGSSFMETDVIIADSLKEGAVVELQWFPSRILRVEYLGDSTFRVIANQNSRLSVGEEFRCLSFAKGAPFTALIVKSDNNVNMNYVGGKDTGLSSLSVIKE
ncbi:MAG: hypothetical protein K2L89_06935 [Muribaculaceae bacterium]|nr:hypothetical protein [Muribaculaceae bacterium]